MCNFFFFVKAISEMFFCFHRDLKTLNEDHTISLSKFCSVYFDQPSIKIMYIWYLFCVHGLIFYEKIHVIYLSAVDIHHIIKHNKDIFIDNEFILPVSDGKVNFGAIYWAIPYSQACVVWTHITRVYSSNLSMPQCLSHNCLEYLWVL